MTELENIFNFITEKCYRCFKNKVIEQEVDIPIKTLDNYLNKRKYRSFIPDQIEKLISVLVEFGYKPIEKELNKQ